MAHRIARRPDIGVVTCAISGDIDLATVPELQRSLGSIIEAGYTSIILDLAEVDYIDSTAFSLLVWLDRQLVDAQGSVILAGANEKVQRILNMTQIVTYMSALNTSENVEAALVALDRGEIESDLLWEHRFEVESSIDNLANMRHQSDEVLSSLEFTDAEKFDIRISLGEALANAVRHGSGEDGEMITVAIRAFEDRVAIDVIDSGTGFSGDHCASDDLYAPSGRGIMFMNALMDSVSFAPGSDGGTVVTMEKRRGGLLANAVEKTDKSLGRNSYDG